MKDFRRSNRGLDESAVRSLLSARRRAQARTDADVDARALVDDLLDRELDPQARAYALRRIEQDAHARRELHETQAALDALRAPIKAPDLAVSIVAEVGARRGWLDAPSRRLVTVGRLAMAASFLLALTVVLVAERHAPGAMEWADGRPTPLSELVEAGQQDAQAGLASLVGSLETYRRAEAPPTDPPRVRRYHVLLNPSTGAISRKSLTFTDSSGQRPVNVFKRHEVAPCDNSTRRSALFFDEAAGTLTLFDFEGNLGRAELFQRAADPCPSELGGITESQTPLSWKLAPDSSGKWRRFTIIERAKSDTAPDDR